MTNGQNSSEDDGVRFLARGGGHVAYRQQPGRDPTVVFLPGYASSMGGTKAEHLAAHCLGRGQAFVRLDYPGHGLSSGAFEAYVLGDWLAAALAVLDHAVLGRFVLVGSSMGGWLMLLAGMARPRRLAGLVGAAAAPDFTRHLRERVLDADAHRTLRDQGVVRLPSLYGDPLPLTRRFLEEAEAHLVLTGTIPIPCRVHLLHGEHDPDVPWRTALDLAARLASRHVTVELVKDGGHRLSRPTDLARLAAALGRVLEAAD